MSSAQLMTCLQLSPSHASLHGMGQSPSPSPSTTLWVQQQEAPQAYMLCNDPALQQQCVWQASSAQPQPQVQVQMELPTSAACMDVNGVPCGSVQLVTGVQDNSLISLPLGQTFSTNLGSGPIILQVQGSGAVQGIPQQQLGGFVGVQQPMQQQVVTLASGKQLQQLPVECTGFMQQPLQQPMQQQLVTLASGEQMLLVTPGVSTLQPQQMVYVVGDADLNGAMCAQLQQLQAAVQRLSCETAAVQQVLLTTQQGTQLVQAPNHVAVTEGALAPGSCLMAYRPADPSMPAMANSSSAAYPMVSLASPSPACNSGQVQQEMLPGQPAPHVVLLSSNGLPAGAPHTATVAAHSAASLQQQHQYAAAAGGYVSGPGALVGGGGPQQQLLQGPLRVKQQPAPSHSAGAGMGAGAAMQAAASNMGPAGGAAVAAAAVAGAGAPAAAGAQGAGASGAVGTGPISQGPWAQIPLAQGLQQLWNNQQLQQASGGRLFNVQQLAWHPPDAPDPCPCDLYNFQTLKRVMQKLNAVHRIRVRLIKRLHAVADHGTSDLKLVYREVRLLIGEMLQEAALQLRRLEDTRVAGLVRLALALQEALELGPGLVQQ